MRGRNSTWPRRGVALICGHGSRCHLVDRGRSVALRGGGVAGLDRGRAGRDVPRRGCGDELSQLKSGEIALLENIRYEASETSKDESERKVLAQKLSEYGEAFISDGFGAVHRKHASVFDVAKLLPHAAGFLVSAEVDVLKKLTENPQRPYGVVLGGAKVSDKLAVIENLLGKVNVMAIGGGMVWPQKIGHAIMRLLIV